jgi:hypothetical protein
MLSVKFILMILALICFLLAALDVRTTPRGNLVAAGLFLWLFSELLR